VSDCVHFVAQVLHCNVGLCDDPECC
jgi:hypothetical protein